MKYSEFKELYAKNKKIVIVGPQRSGTTFSAKAIAEDKGVHHIDEMTFQAEQYEKFLRIVENKKGFCVQAPAMTHLSENIIKDIPDVLLVYLNRPIGEIKSSINRIKWGYDEHEKSKMKSVTDVFSHEISAETKYRYLKALSEKNKNIINIDYHSMKVHPLWINKELRVNFGPKRISLPQQ